MAILGVESAVFGVNDLDLCACSLCPANPSRSRRREPRELTRAVMYKGLERGKCGFIALTPDTGYILMRAAPDA